MLLTKVMSPTCPSVTANFYDNEGRRASEPLLLYLIHHIRSLPETNRAVVAFTLFCTNKYIWRINMQHIIFDL